LIKRFSLVRVSIFFLIVILFPLVQKQWLNLYLFDINNFTIYKLLYYLSGLVVPILVVINSLNKFTYYEFDFQKKNKNNEITGKLLLLLTLILSTTISILISRYIFINLNLCLNFFISNNQYLVQLDISKQILLILSISTFLIFQKTKYFLKKIILTNFLIFSIFAWYSQINNSLLIEKVPFYLFKFENLNFLNINFINIAFLLSIEIVFYLWSYISYSSSLSDWKVPKPYKKEVITILKILIFYLFIILYYSILFR
tara:strand:+ start:71 stop:841 length:771 start_codon:yes stop_codon:yes gene_type:complete